MICIIVFKETSPLEAERTGNIKMSSSAFAQLEESEKVSVEAEDSRAASILSSGGSFLPSVSGVTKRTTSMLCHWVTSNWANRNTPSSTAINLRECLPPLYHNAKNMGKTIKVNVNVMF